MILFILSKQIIDSKEVNDINKEYHFCNFDK